MSGIGPEDLDLIELHDCFTIAEIFHYENLGLCEKGEGGRLIDEGITELGGKIPVNPSGGLLAKGHPLGATGVAQIVEIVWQLRGEAGKRQVSNARIGLAHCVGGVVDGLDLGACTIHILKR
jgi:acetyl-CoA acetyltransferase